MTIREIREDDIEAVIELFRKNYGDDYAIPEFYGPRWVKRGIYLAVKLYQNLVANREL